MEEFNSKSDSIDEENHRLNLLIKSLLKKSKSTNKDKSSKSNYKLNLLDDLLEDDGIFMIEYYRLT